MVKAIKALNKQSLTNSVQTTSWRKVLRPMLKETKVSTDFTGSPYLEYLPKMMDWV